MKRALDLIGSASAIVLLSPIMLGVALAIFLTDGLPVFFRQKRCGLHGKTFELLKFRSMVRDAEKIGGHSTAAGDKRITPIGAFIRRTSLDELPQLFNVLRGDMSLVGPRPDVPAQKEDYSQEDWSVRCSVRPGITGLAQAKFRSQATFGQRVDADLDYARNHGVKRDLAIIIQTITRLFGNGAY